jgi:hypothetical protein
MRRALLLLAAAVLVVVPAGTAFCAAFYPNRCRILPVAFWVIYLLVSLWTIFYSPVMVDRLTSRHAGSNHQGAAYARWGIALGIINLAWSVAEMVWMR